MIKEPVPSRVQADFLDAGGGLGGEGEEDGELALCAGDVEATAEMVVGADRTGAGDVADFGQAFASELPPPFTGTVEEEVRGQGIGEVGFGPVDEDACQLGGALLEDGGWGEDPGWKTGAVEQEFHGAGVDGGHGGIGAVGKGDQADAMPGEESILAAVARQSSGVAQAGDIAGIGLPGKAAGISIGTGDGR